MSTVPPPMDREEEVYIEVPQWPKTVGILSVSWAALGTCCVGGLFSLVTLLPRLLPPEFLQDSPPMFQLTPSMAASFALSLANTILLLVAGIMCLRRAYSSRSLHLCYAIMAVGLIVWGLYAQTQAVAANNAWRDAHPDHPLSKQRDNLVMAFIFSGLGAIYPIFCLVWFGLVKRTEESMTGLPESHQQRPE